MNCWSCGHAIELASGEKVTTRAVCPRCDADLHVCRNCRHYDPRVHQECRETQIEWVRNKDRNNYCDYFSPAAAAGRAARPAAETDVRGKFDDLFKK